MTQNDVIPAARRVALAREPGRPGVSGAVQALITDFFEQRGDRLCADDPAVLAGVGLFHGRPVTVLGTRKGTDLEQNLACHFGMPTPEGYRKALRAMEQAEKFSRPILTFVDTPGAYPGLEAEARGQGAAIAACLELEVPFEKIAEGLKHFTGTNRRFEKKGEIGGVTIIDDYAHHPSEIRATLTAARNYPHRKIWCVFQPHTYTRTKAFMDEFAQALSLADEVILADIYAARETDTLGVSSRDLAEKIEKLGTKATYLPSFDEIETFILENCVHGDLLITMGAGDIVKVGEKLLGQ